MNSLLKTVLSLSLSGSLVILILYGIRALLQHKTSKRWQYYIWLAAVARLLFPFSLDWNPVGSLFQNWESSQASPSPMEESASTLQEGDTSPVPDPPALPQDAPEPSGGSPASTPVNPLSYLWIAWLITAVIALVRKITQYQSFARYVNAGRTEVADIALLDQLAQLGRQSGIKRPIDLYTNSLITTPLLIGFLHPCIVLPTIHLPGPDFQYIILHELTHYKRKDMFYKWLVQLAVSIHWFNPLVYLMSREISRACELACDEAVLQKLFPAERIAYGDTLLHAADAGGSFQNALGSVTLYESKALLKERLVAILDFHKKTRFSSLISIALAFMLGFSAAAMGSYSNAPQDSIPSSPDSDSAAPEFSRLQFSSVQSGKAARYGPLSLHQGVPYLIHANWGGADTLPMKLIDQSGGEITKNIQNGVPAELSVPISGEYFCEFQNITGSALSDFQCSLERADSSFVKMDFSGISITGSGPVGLELVKTNSPEVSFELLSLDNEKNCTTSAEIVDGVMKIDVRYHLAGSVQVTTSPAYRNVVRILIPNAIYSSFELQVSDLVVHMEDFHAPVHAVGSRAGFYLKEPVISQGTYQLQIDSGTIKIEADKILSKIDASVFNGLLELRFHEPPENLNLDSTQCGPVVDRPDTWAALYRVGNGTPAVVLQNTNGKTVIECGPDK